MSHPLGYRGGMKHWWQSWRREAPGRILARFGQAQLVVTAEGRLELRGGSEADFAEAREWISLFLQEAVPQRVGVPAPARPRSRINLPSQRPSASVGAPA